MRRISRTLAGGLAVALTLDLWGTSGAFTTARDEESPIDGRERSKASSEKRTSVGEWTLVHAPPDRARAGSHMLHLPGGTFDTRRTGPTLPAHLRLDPSEYHRPGYRGSSSFANR